ncbi:MAG: nucleoside triphosphate pyrophosphohydrolase [Proteobacteria bacterium]|nr:nucleoside triphosphate pyrophosphohydrolase [Pseudomonadota bacterium]
MKTPGQLFDELVEIFKKLRDPNGGCPWDLKQTHSTLKPYIIEESHEVLDAIDFAPEKLPEELGDVLLQVMLHSQIGSDQKTFNISDVILALSGKMIKRHPHVFGAIEVKDAEGVLKNWERIKQADRKESEGILDGVPRSLPALLRSHRIGEKVSRVNFDWITAEDIKEKVQEELQEFLTAPSTDRDHQEEEFGDLLFTLAQLARKLGFNSEELLQRANQKFIERFKKLETLAGNDRNSWERERLEQLWAQVKASEKNRSVS